MHRFLFWLWRDCKRYELFNIRELLKYSENLIDSEKEIGYIDTYLSVLSLFY